MDGQSEKTPGLALPNPSSEQGASVGMPPTVPLVTSTPVDVPSQPIADPTPTATTGDDTDDLDEEWVNKAKAIVEQTRHDPRLESHELSKVKAEYLRIRYNKHIKVSEEQLK